MATQLRWGLKSDARGPKPKGLTFQLSRSTPASSLRTVL